MMEQQSSWPILRWFDEIGNEIDLDWGLPIIQKLNKMWIMVFPILTSQVNKLELLIYILRKAGKRFFSQPFFSYPFQNWLPVVLSF
jgi:hypothetical protein